MSDAAIVEDAGEAAPAAATRARAADGKFAATDTAPAAVAPTAPATPAAAPAKVPGSIATGAPESVAPAAPQTWPDNWREQMAKETGGEDEKAVAKELKRLQRYASPSAVWGKAAELESKFSAGGLVKIPGPKATDEEKAAYFKATGVPEKPEDYGTKIKLSNNRVLGEADKPVLDSLAARLHPHGATPAVVSAIVDWKLDYDQAQSDQREEADDTFKRQSEIDLRKEWGGSYIANTKAIGRLIDEAPPEVREYFDGGRVGADGRKAGNDPAMLKWLAATALALGYDQLDNHGGGNNPAADELATLRQKARDKPNEYTKEDEARQTQLIEMQQGRRGRRAA